MRFRHARTKIVGAKSIKRQRFARPLESRQQGLDEALWFGQKHEYGEGRQQDVVVHEMEARHPGAKQEKRGCGTSVRPQLPVAQQADPQRDFHDENPKAPAGELNIPMIASIFVLVEIDEKTAGNAQQIAAQENPVLVELEKQGRRLADFEPVEPGMDPYKWHGCQGDTYSGGGHRNAGAPTPREKRDEKERRGPSRLEDHQSPDNASPVLIT